MSKRLAIPVLAVIHLHNVRPALVLRRYTSSQLLSCLQALNNPQTIISQPIVLSVSFFKPRHPTGLNQRTTNYTELVNSEIELLMAVCPILRGPINRHACHQLDLFAQNRKPFATNYGTKLHHCTKRTGRRRSTPRPPSTPRHLHI